MMEKVTLNSKEQKRLMVLNELEKGQITIAQAAKVLDLSDRQIKRIRAAYRKEGAQALAHGNRGRKPAHALAPELAQQLVDLALHKYHDFNFQHFTEALLEHEGIALSRSTVRRVLHANGFTSPKTRRSAKHRRRRERFPKEGMLLQIDGSDHLWLENRGPRLTLIAAIDDATNLVPHALFRYNEDSQGYFFLLRTILDRYGCPGALYHDGFGVFERPASDPDTLKESFSRRTGHREPTQFGRALEELDITSIRALSPQAKGRIERLFGTFQDRLTSELRLAGATTLAQANEVLEAFRPYYNRRFAVPATEPGSAYQPLPVGLSPDSVCCFKYVRTVASDNTVRLGEHCLQILPGKDRLSYARARVEVREGLDGRVSVYYKGQCLASKPAPPEAPVLRARNGRMVRVNPADETDRDDSIPKAELEQRSATIAPTEASPEPVTASPIPVKPRPDHPWYRRGLYPRMTDSLND